MGLLPSEILWRNAGLSCISVSRFAIVGRESVHATVHAAGRIGAYGKRPSTAPPNVHRVLGRVDAGREDGKGHGMHVPADVLPRRPLRDASYARKGREE